MQTRIAFRNVSWLLVLLVALVMLPGCMGVSKYIQYRWNDACEIMELGVTYSDDTQFGLYLCGVGVLGPVGFADLDVKFLGLGGGQFMGIGDGDGKPGFVRHRLKGEGLFLYGEEEMAWGDYNPKRPQTINDQSQGILGIIGAPLGRDPRGFIQGVRDPEKMSHPSYFISCLHYLHLGRVGLVWNIRYLEPFDFIAGIFGLDPFQDDGPQPGRWFGQDRGMTATELGEKYRGRMKSRVEYASPRSTGNVPSARTKGTLPAATKAPATAPAAEAKPLLPGTDVARPIPSLSDIKKTDVPETHAKTEAPAKPETPAKPAEEAKLEATAKPVPVDEPAPAAPEVKVVVVQPGETLAQIAEREYGDKGKWRVIAEASKETVPDPNDIRPGTKLNVPVLATKTEKPLEGKTYTVKKLDTFYSISRAFYGGTPRYWKVIYEANRERLGLQDVKSLKPGMVLVLPDVPEEKAEKKAEE